MWEEMNKTGVYKCPYSMLPENYSERQTTYIRCAEHESHKMYSPEAGNVIKKFCDGDFKSCNYYKKYEEEKQMSKIQELLENADIKEISDNSNQLSLKQATGTALSDSYKKAYSVHIDIKQNGELAEKALLNMCKSLKQMRDEKLYLELGHETFEDYIENNGAYSIKARQAYTYISTYERLGPAILQSNANVGITKLSLLAEVPGYERAEFLEENDLAGISVRELQAELEKYKEKAEQMSFLENDVEKLCDEKMSLVEERDNLIKQNRNIEKIKAELEQIQKEKTKAVKELAELKAKPIDVAVIEPTEEQLNEIREEIFQKAENETAKKIITVQKDVEEKLKRKYEAEIASLQSTAQAEASSSPNYYNHAR